MGRLLEAALGSLPASDTQVAKVHQATIVLAADTLACIAAGDATLVALAVLLLTARALAVAATGMHSTVLRHLGLHNLVLEGLGLAGKLVCHCLAACSYIVCGVHAVGALATMVA